MGITRSINTALAALLVFAASACTVHQADEGPDPFGPSDFALSIGLSASPDSVSWDGTSQSSIVVTANDEAGQPKAGVVVRLEICCDANGNVADNGARLSARTVVTGSDGRGTAIFTAPAPGPFGAPTASTLMSIIATPSGTNMQSGVRRSVEIRLVATGTILPPAETPTAAFVVSSPATANTAITFDASGSCAGALAGGSCLSGGTITSYSWNFGDGTSAAGQVATHSYAVAGTYTATLTVSNDRGLAASTSQTVSVASVAAPSGDWTFSPTPAVVGQTIFFNADAVRAAPGHSLTQFTWNFGDGSAAASGLQTSHVFAAAATYNVSLSVADDAGQKTVISKTIAVGTGNPQPVVTFSPASPDTATTVAFNSSGTTTSGGATITAYAWDFGDPSAATSDQTSTVANPTHRFQRAGGGTYTVRLTVTDSQGRTGTTTTTVSVAP
jgi:PKD repeat protein